MSAALVVVIVAFVVLWVIDLLTLCENVRLEKRIRELEAEQAVLVASCPACDGPIPITPTVLVAAPTTLTCPTCDATALIDRSLPTEKAS